MNNIDIMTDNTNERPSSIGTTVVLLLLGLALMVVFFFIGLFLFSMHAIAGAGLSTGDHYIILVVLASLYIPWTIIFFIVKFLLQTRSQWQAYRWMVLIYFIGLSIIPLYFALPTLLLF